MTKYQIEKEIPLPVGRAGQSECPYPFKEMEIGDSFTTEDGEKFVRNKTSYYGKRLGMKFTCRVLADGTFRIWRTK